ncbi:unnamed protein product [Caenorhabditis auriculariae]|uniref:Uncharacterized protein n=1 Tax=Caenorhabditis auriculariae TaxID=2777116 RepID=A0A8S1HFS9_9PELO|nr:unnamed protein product [Caenorhabditis auriculariae]
MLPPLLYALHSPQREGQPIPQVQARSNRTQRPRRSFLRFMSDVFLRENAFKVYLLLAWGIGLSGVIIAQQKHFVLSMLMLIYLISQIPGLLALVSRYPRYFIPYIAATLVSMAVALVGILHFAFREYSPNYLTYTNKKSKFHKSTVTKSSVILRHLNGVFFSNNSLSVLLCWVILLYLTVCMCACLNLWQIFLEEEFRARRYRQVEAFLRTRLVSFEDLPVEVQFEPDSPPHYSAIDLEGQPTAPEFSPPRYSQWVKMNSRRNDVDSSNGPIVFSLAEKHD